MAYFVIEKGNPKDQGNIIPIEGNTVLIGRSTLGNEPDIALSDECVSRRHAEISFDQNGYRLRDLNSTNGTSLDNARVEPGKAYVLQDDCIIGLGITPAGPRILLRFKGSPTVSTTRLEGEFPSANVPLSWLRIDESKAEIWVDGKLLILPRKEYNLIICLYKKAGELCSRDEIIQGVWPEAIDPGGVADAAIDQLIRRLRMKIERDPSQPRRLVSRKGFGFMLILNDD